MSLKVVEGCGDAFAGHGVDNCSVFNSGDLLFDTDAMKIHCQQS
jgi:hypothetical protein